MAKYNLNILVIAIVGLAIIASGCTGSQDVTSAVKALPEVQQFMNEHPNAKITVTYWSKEEVTQSVQEISQQCDKPITPVAMYKATVSEGEIKIISWINAENQIAICSVTQGSGNSQITNPTPNPTQTQSSTSTTAPTVSIVAQNNADTPILDLKIVNRGGDTIKSGEWKVSVVDVFAGSPFPNFITGTGTFGVGNQIAVSSTTGPGATVSNSFISGGTGLISHNKYDIKMVHIPSNAMLLDTVVEVR